MLAAFMQSQYFSFKKLKLFIFNTCPVFRKDKKKKRNFINFAMSSQDRQTIESLQLLHAIYKYLFIILIVYKPFYFYYCFSSFFFFFFASSTVQQFNIVFCHIWVFFFCFSIFHPSIHLLVFIFFFFTFFYDKNVF